MDSRGTRFAKNTIIITLGRVTTQCVSFFLLPLYTSVLSVSEYGTVDLVNTTVQFFIPIVSLMIDQGIFRFLLTCNDECSKRRVITGGIIVQTIINILVLIIGLVLCMIHKNQYLLWTLLILIATSYSNIGLQIARGIKKTFEYALGSFICSTTMIVLNVVFIVGFNNGAIGMLYASFLGNVISAIVVFLKLRVHRFISFRDFSKEETKELVYYSLPFIPNQLSIWVLNGSDRVIVTFFLGVAANGFLAISHKFPMIFMTIFNVVLLAWHETGAVHFFDDDRDIFLSNMINKLVIFFSVLCISIIIVLPIVFELFVNQSYSEAYYNIPIYLVASLFNVVIGLIGVVYVATKKTGEIAKTTILAAVTNIAVNIMLINWLGLYAASISTLVGYFITLIYRVRDSKKYIDIKYDSRSIIFIAIALFVSIAIFYSKNKIIASLCFPIFAISVYWKYRKYFYELADVVLKRIRNEAK